MRVQHMLQQAIKTPAYVPPALLPQRDTQPGVIVLAPLTEIEDDVPINNTFSGAVHSIASQGHDTRGKDKQLAGAAATGTAPQTSDRRQQAQTQV